MASLAEVSSVDDGASETTASISSVQQQKFDPEHGEELLLCARYGDLEDMEWYLTHGNVPVDFQNESNATALHYACVNGHLDCVKALLKRGASHLPNINNNTPLHWAVQQKHALVVEALCNHSPGYVDVLFKNGFGKSALTVGFSTEDTGIVKTLLEHGSAAALESSRTRKKTTSSSTKKKIRQIKKGESKQGKETKKGDGKGSAPSSTASTNQASSTAGKVNAQRSEGEEGEEGAEQKSADPSGRQVSQRVIHVFNLEDASQGIVAPTLVRVQELAIDWDGATFADNDASKDVTGLYVWSASVVLARWLVSSALSGADMSNSVRGVGAALKGKRVCELGAGAGLPGIAVAAHAGAQSVLLTDLFMHTVQNLEDNIALNSVLLQGIDTRVSARSLDWGNPDQWPKETFDVVIGSDLVYSKSMVSTLVGVVKGMLLGEGTLDEADAEDYSHGVFYYSASTTERDGMPEFVDAMGEAGFKLCTRVIAPEEYHANPLHEATQTKCDLHFAGLKSKQFELFEWRI